MIIDYKQFYISLKKGGMRLYDKIVMRLAQGQTVYLLNWFYSTAIVCSPDGVYYKAKHKGGEEYDIHRSTDLVCECFEDIHEITKDEYDKY